MIVEILPEAENEFFDLILFLASEESGLGDRFVSVSEYSLKLLSAFPEAGNPIFKHFRRFVMRPFNYDLVYKIRSEKIIVIAFAHQSRKPG